MTDQNVARISVHGLWSSRMAFVLATIGSAVGLGNIWKFPYITGEYGGGAFVLVYLLCVAVIGIPVMMAEILLGRRGRSSPINTMRILTIEQGTSRAWRSIGYLGVLSGFVILSFYCVVAGWALAYIVATGSGNLSAVNGAGAQTYFGDLVGSPWLLLMWHSLFLIMTMFVVARGVRFGLERAVTILMPLLFIMLLIMVAYAYVAGDFAAGMTFLFKPDFYKVFHMCTGTGAEQVCKLSGEPIIVAMGHAFFTLSLGMGAVMAYGSYMPEQLSIGKSSLAIGFADTLVALLAGMAIFPIVFASGLEPGAGPGLIFQTLPVAFGGMPGGRWFGTVFFILVLFAAWTSAISIAEPAVAWLIERFNWSRQRVALLVGMLAWLLGVCALLSFNVWSGEEYQLFGKTFFDLEDFLATNILLPLGGLLIALFVGYGATREMSRSELAFKRPGLYAFWRFVIRYVSPVGIIIVFLNAIGVF